MKSRASGRAAFFSRPREKMGMGWDISGGATKKIEKKVPYMPATKRRVEKKTD
jgi:hypothetical protein